MRSIPRYLLIAVPIGAAVGWIFWFTSDRQTREEPNYTLIEDRLWMGGLVPEPPRGTRAVLNLCEVPDPYHSGSYLWEPLNDAEPGPSLDGLRRLVEFVGERRRAGDPVYVHCRNGVSRSGLAVTAHLMAEHRWTRDQALAFIRSKRPVVRPSPPYMQLLLEWEEGLKAKSPGGGL
jgi:Dual specificity phosphatase, catalytic domain